MFSFRSSNSGALIAQMRCCSCLGCLEHFEDPEGHCLLEDVSMSGPIVHHEMPSKADLTSSQLEKDAVPGFNYDTLEDFWKSLAVGSFVGFRIHADDAETAAPRFCIAMVTEAAHQLERQERRGSNIFYKGWFVVKVTHLQWEKTMLNDDNIYKVQQSAENLLNCATLLEVPPLMMVAMPLGRYALRADVLQFVMRYATLGSAPKRRRAKPAAVVAMVESSPAVYPLWTGEHNDLCETCEKCGRLQCCSYCNVVFHKRCLDAPSLERLRVMQHWPCRLCHEDMESLPSRAATT